MTAAPMGKAIPAANMDVAETAAEAIKRAKKRRLCAADAGKAFFFVSFSKQKPPAEPVEMKSLDKRNPPLL